MAPPVMRPVASAQSSRTALWCCCQGGWPRNRMFPSNLRRTFRFKENSSWCSFLPSSLGRRSGDDGIAFGVNTVCGLAEVPEMFAVGRLLNQTKNHARPFRGLGAANGFHVGLFARD